MELLQELVDINIVFLLKSAPQPKTMVTIYHTIGPMFGLHQIDTNATLESFFQRREMNKGK